jgi:DNA end-binding protein Ku
MARAIWKGVIRFGEQATPVKLYSAVEDRTVRFRLLNAETGRPVKQRMVNPETGDPVDYDDVRRGYEIEPGVYVMLDDEELEEVQPEKSRDIEITRFLDPETLTHQWYDRPYHLGPDGDPAPYYALLDALVAESKEGLARWTMRNREYSGALRVRDDHLMMITLRHAEEVIPASVLEAPSGREPEEQELAMAEQLVDALAGPFDPTDYEDEYRGRVLELIEAKAEGKTVEFRQPEKKRAAGNLAASLEASIQAAKERKSA